MSDVKYNCADDAGDFQCGHAAPIKHEDSELIRYTHNESTGCHRCVGCGRYRKRERKKQRENYFHDLHCREVAIYSSA